MLGDFSVFFDFKYSIFLLMSSLSSSLNFFIIPRSFSLSLLILSWFSQDKFTSGNDLSISVEYLLGMKLALVRSLLLALLLTRDSLTPPPRLLYADFMLCRDWERALLVLGFLSTVMFRQGASCLEAWEARLGGFGMFTTSLLFLAFAMFWFTGGSSLLFDPLKFFLFCGGSVLITGCGLFCFLGDSLGYSIISSKSSSPQASSSTSS